MNGFARSERRAHTRLPVDLWIEERLGGSVYYQHATDLSLGGLFLAHTLPHPPGTRVKLRVDLGELDALEVDAEVVDDARDVGMGMRFIAPDREIRARIANFLLAMRSIA